MSTNSMWHPGIPVDYRDRVVCGDARVLSESIPDNSIDCIITDPIYENLADYEWLAHLAMRVLKPDSPLLAYCAIGLLPETHDALRRGGLTYRWRLITRTIYSNEFHGRLIIGTQECLWYEKGKSTPLVSIFDLNMGTMQTKGNYGVNGSNWGKGTDVLGRYIVTFARPNAIVFDPFCGSGSTPAICKQLGRHYIAFEIDPATARNAQHRIDNTQPPLFVLNDEQLSLDLE